MKLKKFKCPDTGILFEYNETAEIYVSEDAENLMTVEQADKMLKEGKIKFNKSDVISEKKKIKKEADDEEDGTDDDEAIDEGEDEPDGDEEEIEEADDEEEIEEADDEEEIEEADDEEECEEGEDEPDGDEKVSEKKKLRKEGGGLANFGDKKAAPFKKDESLNLDFSTSLTEEDKSALFAGEELSEAYQAKTITIFESAVSAKVKELAIKTKAFYSKAADAKVVKLESVLQNQVNDYLDYVITEWVAENEIAIENSLKNEMNEIFLDGLKGLFSEHYIEVPDNRYDILEGLADKVESLTIQLDEQLTKNSALLAENKGQTRDKIISKLSHGLSENQSEKFAALVEHVDSDDLEKFEKKALSLKESYFKSADPAKPNGGSIDKSTHNTSNVTTSKEWDALMSRAANI